MLSVTILQLLVIDHAQRHHALSIDQQHVVHLDYRCPNTTAASSTAALAVFFTATSQHATLHNIMLDHDEVSVWIITHFGAGHWQLTSAAQCS